MNMAEENCVHYWEIEEANGPTSKGVCKYCHAVKYFFNAFPEGRLNPYLEIMEAPVLAEVA